MNTSQSADTHSIAEFKIADTRPAGAGITRPFGEMSQVVVRADDIRPYKLPRILMIAIISANLYFLCSILIMFPSPFL